MLVLFYWDGISSIVQDVDYFLWGDYDKGFSKTGFVASLPNHRSNLKALIDFFKLMVLNPLGLYSFDDKDKWFCIKKTS